MDRPKVTSTYQTAAYAIGLLIFGSLNTLTMKAEFLSKSSGLTGPPKPFSKPWFANANVFFACTVVLFYDVCSRWGPCSRKTTTLTGPLLVPEVEAPAKPSSGERSYWAKVALVSIPATVDVVATGLGCAGMMYVPASVWQMMRGSMIIFTAMFSTLFLKQRMLCYNWFGILLCLLGVVVVGFASVMEGGASDGATDSDQQSAYVLGVGMILLAQVFQAAQVVLEEWLLKQVQLEGLQIIGWEGAWGLLIILLGYPVLYALPGSDNGHLEDPFDTAVMIANSGPLLLIVLAYTFSCATYNVAGISVTGCLSSMHRVLIEASRTLVVWAVALIIHYVDADSAYGEAWTPNSYVRLGGFLVLTLGQATYGGLLKWPFLSYPPEESVPCEEYRSPTGLINLVPPPTPQRTYQLEPSQ